MDRIATDLMGPFPVSTNNNRYILVVMDYFTKYVEAYAIPDQKAETVANTIVFEFFSRFGLPLDLHSDQGKNYQSELFRQVCCLLEINQSKSTSYRACSNGMVERFNQTLLNMSTTYVDEEQKMWDIYLPLVTAVYRSSVHDSTEYTPNMLMFGREFNLPVHFLVGQPANEPQDITYVDYVENLNTKLTNIYQHVRKHLKQNSERQKKSYDTRISVNNYEVGDMVYLLDSTKKLGKSPKLKSDIWKGPCVIIRKISDILFEIKNSPKKRPKIIHHDRLKPYLTESSPQWAVSLQKQVKGNHS